ncbi:MAG: LlaMI family restriction endonuclease [Bacteroidota bacterium]
MDKKNKIIQLFDKNVRGKSSDTKGYNPDHDGKSGHWLEVQMGIKANASNSPDLLGYEMKNDTTSKTTFGDWSASKYIFSKTSTYGINRKQFLQIFGQPNPLKNGRHSWSGKPCPKIDKFNDFGQILKIDSHNNILALYHFSKDNRADKSKIVPKNLQIEGLELAKWNASNLQEKVENKFNQSGWFKCLKNNQGVYISIVFGDPITYTNWLKLVKSGDIFFDSGMYDGNLRHYSQWRSLNSFWNKLIVSRH